MNENLWEELEFEVENCKLCKLSMNRNKTVLGKGKRDAKLMFISEAPGKDEEEHGVPFIGRAGKLFSKILSTVGLDEKEVYITNVIKCRPPKNRNPEEDELSSCLSYLETQIALVNPSIIVTVGSVSSKWLLKDRMKEGITKIRGRIIDWEGGIKVIPILHPSFLLRNTSTTEGSPKWNTWQDMKMIKEEFDSL